MNPIVQAVRLLVKDNIENKERLKEDILTSLSLTETQIKLIAPERAHEITSIFKETNEVISNYKDMKLSLRDYFNGYGPVLRLIEKNKLLSSIIENISAANTSHRIPVFSPNSNVDDLVEFENNLRSLIEDFVNQTPTIFEGDGVINLLDTTDVKLKSGFYMTSASEVAIVLAGGSDYDNHCPKHIFKLTKTSYSLLIYHPIEDIWIPYDGSVMFRDIMASLNGQYKEVLKKALVPKKAFSYVDEIVSIEKRIIAIASLADKLPPSLFLQEAKSAFNFYKTHYPYDTRVEGFCVKQLTVFCVRVESIMIQFNINFYKKENGETFNRCETVYLMYAGNTDYSIASISLEMVPFKTRHELVTKSKFILDTVEQKLMANK